MRFNLLFISLLLVCFSCTKDPQPNPPAAEKLAHGLLVLQEGLFQQNNASLSWINTVDGSINLTFFEQHTNRSLGDTGNDLAQYGNKIYIVVNVSSTVEVLDATSGQSLKQIPFFVGNTAKQPRSIAFNGSKAFVSCYDGYVDVIDTNSLTIEQRIPVGPNPEGLAVSNGKLFVANSGGLNFPDVDSSVSVISLQTFTEITRIPVGLNPGSIAVDPQGDVYVISRGNYGTIPAKLHRINSISNTKESTFDLAATTIALFESHFLIPYRAASGELSIALFDPLTETIENAHFLDLSQIQTLYGISYSPKTQLIYCCDAMNYTTTGYIHVFNSTANYITNYHVGLNPSKVLIYD